MEAVKAAVETANWYWHLVWEKYPMMLVGVLALLIGGGFVLHGLSGFSIDAVDGYKELPSPLWVVIGIMFFAGGLFITGVEIRDFVRGLRKDG